jgi:hypothetical protein
VSPSSGPLAGGTAVTITGTSFPETLDSVRVGTGLLVGLMRVSAIQLAGTTPAGSAAGAVDVTVYTTGAGNGTCAGCFTYYATLTVRYLWPVAGPSGVATPVTVVGTAFPAVVDSVRLGTTLMQNVVRVGDTVLTGTVPAVAAVGPADVSVYTGSAGIATCHACFTFVPFGRYSVTFLGADFDSSKAVDMNDSGALVGTVWSAATGWRGHLWPYAGAADDLDTLLPVAINNLDWVLGNIGESLVTPAIWKSGMVSRLSGPGNFTALGPVVYDINDQGQVALRLYGGWGEIWHDDSLVLISRETAIWAVISLGRMNSRGEVAGTCTVSGPSPKGACILSAAGPQLMMATTATAINDSSTVVGSCPCLFAPPGARGFVLSAGSLSAPAGFLPFAPVALSNRPEVVGEGSIWHDGATIMLSSVVADSSWQISGAVAINDRGQIAAYGVNIVTAQQGAVRLDPIPNASGSSAKRLR